MVPGGEAPDDHAVVPARIKVGGQDGDRLADEPTAVDEDTETAEREPCVLKIEQLSGGKVNGDLVVVLFPACCQAFI